MIWWRCIINWEGVEEGLVAKWRYYQGLGELEKNPRETSNNLTIVVPAEIQIEH
jgi:hypothetical protein